MQVMVLDHTDDVEILRTLGEEWKSNAGNIPLPIDVNIGLDTMRRLVFASDGDVIVLSDNGIIKGFMGLRYGLNHVGPGMIANECCFYVTPSARSGGQRLRIAARRLARSKGCNFLILNANRLAGDADRAGQYYERGGALPLETAYLEVL